MLAVLIVLAALLVAGCGAGGEGAPTKAAYLRQANRICRQGEEAERAAITAATRELGLADGARLSLADQERMMLAAMGPWGATMTRLAELPAPAGHEAKVEEMVARMTRAVAKARRNPRSVVYGAGPFTRSDEMAERFGMARCAF